MVMFSRAGVLDPGIRVIAFEYGVVGMEVHRVEAGWTFTCGTKAHRIPEAVAFGLMQRDGYDGITAMVRDACRAIS